MTMTAVGPRASSSSGTLDRGHRAALHSRAVTRVELHPLAGSKRAGQLARLIDELYSSGRRIVVWVEDEGRLQALDDFLWTFTKLGFVPHTVWAPSMGDVDDPVVLVGVPANPNGAQVLVVADDPPEGAWMTGFEEIHDLVPEGPEGAARTAAWERWRTRHAGGA
jgi:DNA polymerase-3 subunit chi